MGAIDGSKKRSKSEKIPRPFFDVSHAGKLKQGK
jgi:hypothetical protein